MTTEAATPHRFGLHTRGMPSGSCRASRPSRSPRSTRSLQRSAGRTWSPSAMHSCCAFPSSRTQSGSGLHVVHDLMPGHGAPAVRVGLHHGSYVERDGDFFGAVVILAARVSGQAVGGEVLLTGHTAALAPDCPRPAPRGPPASRCARPHPVKQPIQRLALAVPTPEHLTTTPRSQSFVDQVLGGVRHHQPAPNLVRDHLEVNSAAPAPDAVAVRTLGDRASQRAGRSRPPAA